MENHELTEILVYFNPKRSQLYEFKKHFARAINLSNVDEKLWKIHIKRLTKDAPLYELEVKFDGEGIAYFGLIGVEHVSLTIGDLENLNVTAEKMLLTEETRYGVKDDTALESLINRMDFVPFGHDERPTIIDKAAYLWYTIATKQMFWNGNKRTALLTAILFLHVNGYKFNLQDVSKEYDISVSLAERKMSLNQLKQHIELSITMDTEYLKKTAEEILNGNS